MVIADRRCPTCGDMDAHDLRDVIVEIIQSPFESEERLTPLLRETANLMARGLSSSEIGQLLGVSTKTAQDRMTRVSDALEVQPKKVPNLVYMQIIDLFEEA